MDLEWLGMVLTKGSNVIKIFYTVNTSINVYKDFPPARYTVILGYFFSRYIVIPGSFVAVDHEILTVYPYERYTS